jgi:alkanesulfonate monooxygenase SsuD/methylene tetrahydromethanopterin reductase-like flavin-dependent oxidoreductase (luciferase family)
MQIGAITFGTLLPDPHTGRRISQRERLAEVIDHAVLAEELGFAWYAVGEHHFGERDVIASPPVVLGAIAQRTSSITLATGTTLLANRDPVLVAEDYATVDLVSDGRLQMIAGASFFAEPYAVFDQAPETKAARIVRRSTACSCSHGCCNRSPRSGSAAGPSPNRCTSPSTSVCRW